MKKILTLLGALTLTASSSATVIACNKGDKGEDVFDKEPPNYEGKSVEELKTFLEKTKKLTNEIEDSLGQKTYDYLVEKGFKEFIKLNEEGHLDIIEGTSEEKKKEIHEASLQMYKVLKEWFEYQAYHFDELELDFLIFSKDPSHDTSIKTKAILIKTIKEDIEDWREGEGGYNYLHQNIEAYANKIIARHQSK